MDHLIPTLALIAGAGWASGINVYAAVLLLGLLGATGTIELPAGLAVLADPLVIAAAGLMYLVEFFADKVPGADTAWDTLHTFVRIPAGALLAAGVVGDSGPAVEIAAGLLGGALATTAHAAKAGTRVLINTSPEPFTNWIASITEDLGVLGGLLLALTHPLVFLGLLGLFVLLVIWLLPKLWRGIKRVFRFLLRLFGVRAEAPPASGSAAVDRAPPALTPPTGRTRR